MSARRKDRGKSPARRSPSRGRSRSKTRSGNAVRRRSDDRSSSPGRAGRPRDRAKSAVSLAATNAVTDLPDSKDQSGSSRRSRIVSSAAPRVNYRHEPKVKRGLDALLKNAVGIGVLHAAQRASDAGFDMRAGDATRFYPDYFGKLDLIKVSNQNIAWLYPEGRAQMLIMELTNLSNKARFLRLDQAVAAGKLRRAEYIRRNEEIEYEGVRNVIDAYDAAGGKWKYDHWEKHRDKTGDFETYWTEYLNGTDIGQMHLQHFATQFDKIVAGTIAIPQPTPEPVAAAPSFASSSSSSDFAPVAMDVSAAVAPVVASTGLSGLATLYASSSDDDDADE
jgi:hypothetical protein